MSEASYFNRYASVIPEGLPPVAAFVMGAEAERARIEASQEDLVVASHERALDALFDQIVSIAPWPGVRCARDEGREWARPEDEFDEAVRLANSWDE